MPRSPGAPKLRLTGWGFGVLILSACAGSQERPGESEAALRAASAQVRPEGPAPTLRATELVGVPAGIHYPLYPGKNEPAELLVTAFLLEETPVTNAQFLAFVWEHPEWRRSRVAPLFADQGYLRHWTDDLVVDEALLRAPVTNVSWFAARAYAASIGRRLPSLAEWEYVGAASESSASGREEEGYNQVILDWYARPTPAVLPPVGGDSANYYGLRDLHGLIWEWVEDFNSALVTGESRGDAGLDRKLFCGSSSIGAADPSDYAAFMRFAYRSSLDARYTVNNLGFRCAADGPSGPED